MQQNQMDTSQVRINMKKRYNGTVIHSNDRDGYGFINTSDIFNPDFPEEPVTVFGHHSKIERDFPKYFSIGQFVSFNVARGEKGLNAVAIQPFDPLEDQELKETVIG